MKNATFNHKERFAQKNPSFVIIKNIYELNKNSKANKYGR